MNQNKGRGSNLSPQFEQQMAFPGYEGMIPSEPAPESFPDYKAYRAKGRSGEQYDTDVQRWNVREASNIASDIAQYGQIASRAPASAIPSILESGMKTQRETGYSGGMFNPDLRDQVEDKVFGDGSSPVYGYMQFRGDIDEKNTAPYGSAKINFKRDRVGPHTTFTLGDSLDSRGYIQAFGANQERRIGAGDIDPSNVGHNASGFGYAEAQIHARPGKDDIASIEFDDSRRFAPSSDDTDFGGSWGEDDVEEDMGWKATDHFQDRIKAADAAESHGIPTRFAINRKETQMEFLHDEKTNTLQEPPASVPTGREREVYEYRLPVTRDEWEKSLRGGM